MIRFLKNRGAGLAVLLLFAAAACTKVDDNLGSGVVPPGDRFTLRTKTVESGFSIRSVQPDSMLTDNSESYYLGSAVFPRMGRVDAAFLTQCFPGSFPDEKEFPATAKVDSAFVVLNQHGYKGTTGYELEMAMYELTKPLPYHRDSSYYSNFPVGEYIGETPDYTVTLTSGKPIYFRVDPSYVEKYIRASKQLNEDEDEYHDTFPGYYFKTNSAYGSGSLYRIDPNSSGIKVYYHTAEKPAEALDFTVTFAHIVDNQTTGTQSVVNEGVSFFERDYSFADPAFGFDAESTEKTYVMGLLGLVTELTLPEGFIGEIRSKLGDEVGYETGILRAELVLPVADPSDGGLDNAIDDLGLYYDFQGFEFMPSYLPNSTSGNAPGFDGTLNRAKKCYSMDVTSYVQKLVNGSADRFVLQVAPAVTATFSFGCTVIENTPENPVRLEITYLDKLR